MSISLSKYSCGTQESRAAHASSQCKSMCSSVHARGWVKEHGNCSLESVTGSCMVHRTRLRRQPRSSRRRLHSIRLRLPSIRPRVRASVITDARKLDLTGKWRARYHQMRFNEPVTTVLFASFSGKPLSFPVTAKSGAFFLPFTPYLHPSPLGPPPLGATPLRLSRARSPRARRE